MISFYILTHFFLIPNMVSKQILGSLLPHFYFFLFPMIVREESTTSSSNRLALQILPTSSDLK